MEAEDLKAAVNMYRVNDMWEDAYRVCTATTTTVPAETPDVLTQHQLLETDVGLNLSLLLHQTPLRKSMVLAEGD